jgi:hypothetical protein
LMHSAVLLHPYFCVRRTNFENSKLYVIITNRKLNQKTKTQWMKTKLCTHKDVKPVIRLKFE